MEHDEPVPEADAQEQQEPAEQVVASFDVAEVGDKPEADALEQASPVVAAPTRVMTKGRDDVPEADWLEQSVAEPEDDYEAR